MDERNTGCSKHNHGRHDNCSCGGHSHEGHAHGDNCGCGAHSHVNHEHNDNCSCGAHSHGDHEHGGNCGCGAHSHENHEHDDNCGCGVHSHDGHEHDDNCGCGGHSHEGHAHDDNCGCGHHHHAPDYENGLSIGENNVLMALLERGALPVARFALTSSKEPEAYAVALEPVYIADPGDSLDAIREYGMLFEGLEDKGLIGMDYKRPLPGYPYREYRESAAFRHFAETAAEAKERGFTYDTPNLELGGITLTECGQETVDRMIR